MVPGGIVGWIKKLDGPRGVRYKVGYRDPNRRLRYRTFPRRRDAEAYLASVENAKHVGSYLDPSLGAVTLESFWGHFWRTSKPPAESTQALYEVHARRHIMPYLGNQKLNSLSKADVRLWIAELGESGVGAPTVNASQRLLRRVLNVAVDEGRIAANPAAKLGIKKPAKREIKPITIEQLRAISEEVDDRYRALVLLLGFCGLRIGEASALRVRSVDLMRRRILIVASACEVGGRRIERESTKTGVSRSVTLPRFLAEELTLHLAAFSDPADPDALVFRSTGGGAVRQTAFRNRVFQPACRRLGMDPVPRVHDLRHTAVALAIEQGGTAKEVQELVGHSSIVVTMDVYGHLFENIQERLADKMDAAYRANLGQQILDSPAEL
jgi:integrase